MQEPTEWLISVPPLADVDNRPPEVIGEDTVLGLSNADFFNSCSFIQAPRRGAESSCRGVCGKVGHTVS